MRAQADGLLDSLKLVQLTGHQRYGSVEVFHLSWPCSNGLDYVTLDESLAAGWIEITEFTDTGQVPRIKIVNRSQHMVFLMAGEESRAERHHDGSRAERDADPRDVCRARSLGIY